MVDKRSTDLRHEFGRCRSVAAGIEYPRMIWYVHKVTFVHSLINAVYAKGICQMIPVSIRNLQLASSCQTSWILMWLSVPNVSRLSWTGYLNSPAAVLFFFGGPFPLDFRLYRSQHDIPDDPIDSKIIQFLCFFMILLQIIPCLQVWVHLLVRIL